MWLVDHLWLIPLLPFVAAGITALLKRAKREASQFIVIGAMTISMLLSFWALGIVMSSAGPGEVKHFVSNFTWFTYGEGKSVELGFLLDPLSAMMLVVVTLVSWLVFIFSVGYMDEDENATRFFCFLSLFAGSMLALVISNSLLLLFMAWELVGLSSYLLIGFWYHKESAAAAMRKAFIVTRVGDIGFFIGILWLYAKTGTTLFYDPSTGQGCLEVAKAALGAWAALWISLLIFCGAMGKSGQFPLHVWLPDAMEGPTPVSALIHAATMVAAGVFLVGRMYPVFEVNPVALDVVAFTGAFTALFAATIATAQWDIKRILAYSTVSQLGYMMMGLGIGGYVAGLFHLFTHAFFKALLFLGSGSIIHACHHEQDIRKMGGLGAKMHWTFPFYGIGSLALAGFPLLFSGFYSKDELLLGALHYHERLNHWTAWLPFIFGLVGALFTAFYMTRQVRYVFFGKPRGHGAEDAHECGPSIVFPLAVLAFLAVVTGFLGFPDHSFIHHFLGPNTDAHGANYYLMFGSSAVVILSIIVGWKVYSGKVLEPGAADPIEARWPGLFRVLHNKYYVDEFYEATVVKGTRCVAWGLSIFDRYVLNGLCVIGTSLGVVVLSWISQLLDEQGINRGFDKGCSAVRGASWWNRWIQNGLSQHYLKLAGAGIILIFILTHYFGRR